MHETLNYPEENKFQNASVQTLEQKELDASTQEMKNGLQTIVESSKEEEKWLLQIIGLDKKKYLEDFKELSQDKDIENWLNKVFDKCSNEYFENKWKIFENIDISQTVKDILNQDPSLGIYIAWELKIPFWKTKFSELTNEQKVNFTALYETIYNQHNIQIKDTIERCNFKLNNYQEKITNKIKTKNLSNRWVLKNTLIKDFWLTETEAQKLQKYLILINKRPEFIWNNVVEAWIWKFWWWVIIWVIGWILSSLWVILTVDKIKNLLKPNPETTINTWTVVIDEPEAIQQLLTQSFHFAPHSGTETKTLYPEDSGFVKRIINKAESKTITMEIEWHIALKYDLKWSRLEIDKSTWIANFYVNKPEIIILDSKSHVIDKNWAILEDPFKEFNDVELELEERLKQEVIDMEKNNNYRYVEWVKNSEQVLLDLFEKIKPFWVDVKSVNIIYNNLKLPTEKN